MLCTGTIAGRTIDSTIDNCLIQECTVLANNSYYNSTFKVGKIEDSDKEEVLYKYDKGQKVKQGDVGTVKPDYGKLASLYEKESYGYYYNTLTNEIYKIDKENKKIEVLENEVTAESNYSVGGAIGSMEAKTDLSYFSAKIYIRTFKIKHFPISICKTIFQSRHRNGAGFFIYRRVFF